MTNNGTATAGCTSSVEIPLYDYQIETKEFIKSHPYCGIFLDMGFGKTRSTLAALYDLKPSGNILIVAPKTIARATWVDEIAEINLPVRTESLIVNEKGKQLSKKKRLEKYANINSSPAAMYFINRELIGDLVNYFEENKLKWPFPTVVIDEFQSFKSSKSDRFRSLKKVRPQISRLIGLTGTPTPNGLVDLWSEIYLLDMGQRLGRTKTLYLDTFFDVAMICNGYPVGWTPKRHMPNMPYDHWLKNHYGLEQNQYLFLPDHEKAAYQQLYQHYIHTNVSAEDEIYKRIDDICMSIKNTSVKLPDLIMEDVFVEMDDNEKKIYDSMKKESVLELVEGSGSDQITTEIIASNAAVLQAKLLQLASGSIYTEDTTIVNGYRVYKEIHTKKIDMCKYIVENTSSPVIIAYHYRCDAKRLLESIDGAVLFDKTPEMIHDWNDNKIKVMLMQPASAGHGLNLQKGDGHTLIWFTIPWSLEEYEQMNARLYRNGQKNTVTIYRIFTKHTFDARVAARIERKSLSQRELIEAVELELSEDQDDE